MQSPRDFRFFLLLRLHVWDQSPALGSVLHPSFFQWALKVEHRILGLYSKKKSPLFQSEESQGSSVLRVGTLLAPIFLQKSA